MQKLQMYQKALENGLRKERSYLGWLVAALTVLVVDVVSVFVILLSVDWLRLTALGWVSVCAMMVIGVIIGMIATLVSSTSVAVLAHHMLFVWIFGVLPPKHNESFQAPTYRHAVKVVDRRLHVLAVLIDAFECQGRIRARNWRKNLYQWYSRIALSVSVPVPGLGSSLRRAQQRRASSI